LGLKKVRVSGEKYIDVAEKLAFAAKKVKIKLKKVRIGGDFILAQLV
jgi:hypothetical protein